MIIERAKRVLNIEAEAIERLEPKSIGPEEACGCRAVGGLLLVAKKKGLRVETIDLRSSGDTAGDRDRVVGYGTFVVT